MNLRRVLEFYKTAGHFVNLNFNNMNAGLRVLNLSSADESGVVKLMETGLTDWRVAYEESPFDHPEICVPHGHDADFGQSILAGIPVTRQDGISQLMQSLKNAKIWAHSYFRQ
ncbi:hypothetical protein [Kaarinaea lacus]